MPWKAATAMSLRLEFVLLAMNETANIRSLCRRYEISPKTAYKWLDRFHEHGAKGLEDHSRRPHHSPFQTAHGVEHLILRLRKKHPAWGARKLRHRLVTQSYRDLPSISTMTAILRRHGCLNPLETQKHQPYQRFEASAPNLLWQMDFKGDFAVLGGRCYPLTILDDHSRFALGLVACSNQRLETVQQHLTATFRRYGLPQRILTDNGGPWGSCGHDAYTEFDLWMIRLGIERSHSRICHPQTLGKDERFHRTMMDELITRRSFTSTEHCQQHFDRWRSIYNLERPHEALAMDVPTNRYQPSPREYPKTLPPVTYAEGDTIRKVGDHGEISFRGREFKLGKAFDGHPVALRPTTTDGLYDVFFCHQHIAQINLKSDLPPS